MSAIPATFRAFVATREGDRIVRGVRPFAEADLPPGDVEIRVGWSSVNYKDGLATIPNGRVARIDPLVSGIDLAGEVVASEDPAILIGSSVLAHGYELGVSRHGGYAEYQRVPAGWVVPLPAGLTPRLAMAIGTAGFTAALSVIALEERGLVPGAGPVLVTGASGGVGSMAVGILAGRGHDVWAASGKADEADRLRGLDAAGVLTREEVTAESPKPLGSERWAGAVDCVGGEDAAVHPAHAASRRDGGGIGEHRGAGLRDHRLPVHPPLGGARRRRLGGRADRGPPGDLGAARHGPAPERPGRRDHRGDAGHAAGGARLHPRRPRPGPLDRPRRGVGAPCPPPATRCAGRAG